MFWTRLSGKEQIYDILDKTSEKEQTVVKAVCSSDEWEKEEVIMRRRMMIIIADSDAEDT